MKKKVIIFLIILIILIIGGVIAFNIIQDSKEKKQEEKIEEAQKRDDEAFALLREACTNLLDSEGNYNVYAPETEVVCEKNFCRITYQGENYIFECSER